MDDQKPKIFEDTLDEKLLAAVNDDGVIPLADLPRKHPEFAKVRYNLLWYRIKTLAAAGRIRVKRERQNLMVYSLDG